MSENNIPYLSKPCTKCKQIKLLSEFNKNKVKKDGLQSHCKCCRKQWRKDNTEKMKQYRKDNANHIGEIQKQWHKDNAEQQKQYRKQYYKDNVEYRKQYEKDNIEWRKQYRKQYEKDNVEWRKQYQKDNAKHIGEIKKRWQKDNAEKMKKYARQYQKDNPEKCAALNAKRRATKKQATPSWYEKEAIENLYSTHKYFKILGREVHVDHIVPLTHPLVCGLHCLANLELIYASENLSKSNTFIV